MSTRLFLLVLGLAAFFVSAGGCGPVTFVVGLTPGDQRMVESVVEHGGRGAGGNRVALIDVSGMIVNAQKPSLLEPGENPVSVLHEQLAAARRDPRVKAVVLRLNTPGGTVTASDAMYREVLRFKEQTGKPVVALMMDVAASGGYYVACASDHIVAYPTTITGSIGVIFQTITVKDGLSRIGVHAEAITSGPNKDVASPLGDLTPEHRALLQHVVDDFYGRFVEVVKASRTNVPEDRWSEVTDGRVFTGSEAAELGVVDEVGDLYDAVEAAQRLAGIPAADVVRYHRPLDHVPSPYAAAPGAQSGAHPGVQTQVNLMQLNLPGAGAGAGAGDSPAGFYYLWRPDLP